MMDEALARELERLCIVAAANGDNGAQDILARTLLESAGTNLPTREALTGAEVLARLAAANGTPEGLRLLAVVLLCRASDLADDDPIRSTRIRWEAVHILETLTEAGVGEAAPCLLSELEAMADEGDEFAAQSLNKWSALLPASVAQAARTPAEPAEVTAHG